MELHFLLAALIKLTQGVTPMLFLVALVVIQLPHQFQLVQQTHHQESQHVLRHAVLIPLTDLVKFHLEVVEHSIEQERAQEQTAQPTQKQILELAVIHSVALGVAGFTVQEVVLEPGLVQRQTAARILKHKLSVM
jgi:hypothetical protein